MDGAVGIGRLSPLQRDLIDHDLVEKIMKQHNGIVSHSPDPTNGRLAAESQPSIVITSDHFKFGAPNRKQADATMKGRRYRRV